MCLATTAYVYMLLRIVLLFFSNGSIIPPGFKFTELHALTLAARSYVLLLQAITAGAKSPSYRLRKQLPPQEAATLS